MPLSSSQRTGLTIIAIGIGFCLLAGVIYIAQSDSGSGESEAASVDSSQVQTISSNKRWRYRGEFVAAYDVRVKGQQPPAGRTVRIPDDDLFYPSSIVLKGGEVLLVSTEKLDPPGYVRVICADAGWQIPDYKKYSEYTELKDCGEGPLRFAAGFKDRTVHVEIVRP